MNDNDLDRKIAALQKELSLNAREMIRIQRVMEDETRELLEAEAERDRISGLKVRVLDGEIQMGVSYHGGRN
jgi:hypothetical protein